MRILLRVLSYRLHKTAFENFSQSFFYFFFNRTVCTPFFLRLRLLSPRFTFIPYLFTLSTTFSFFLFGCLTWLSDLSRSLLYSRSTDKPTQELRAGTGRRPPGLPSCRKVIHTAFRVPPEKRTWFGLCKRLQRFVGFFQDPSTRWGLLRKLSKSSVLLSRMSVTFSFLFFSSWSGHFFSWLFFWLETWESL